MELSLEGKAGSHILEVHQQDVEQLFDKNKWPPYVTGDTKEVILCLLLWRKHNNLRSEKYRMKNVFLQPQAHPYKHLHAFNYSSYSHFIQSLSYQCELRETFRAMGNFTVWTTNLSSYIYFIIFISFFPQYCFTELLLVCSCHICSAQIKMLQPWHIIFWHITVFCFKGFECEKELAEAMDKEKQAKGLLPTKLGSFTIGLGA